MTKQRKVIFDIIQKSEDHLTAEQIFLLAKEEIPSIAVGTVYRNLNLMVSEGEIRKISMFRAPDRFDKTLCPHEHMICSRCGSLKDISLDGLKETLDRQTGTEILSYDLNLYYICPDCYNQ